MRSLSTLLAITLASMAAGSGCSDLEQDAFSMNGGIAPDPTAIAEGTILYVGPRPACLYRDDGSFVRVVGNVILTMFEYDKPPPPEGSATSAVNLLAVSGDELFDSEDCLPKDARPNYAERISRSAPFRWPRLPLGNERTSYQVRGFYDYDEDMIPFFSTTRLPTAGDVIGAALNDVQDATKGLFELTLPAYAEAPNGIIRGGLTVVLGNVVWSERPVFRLNQQRRLPADAPFVPALGGALDAPVPDGPASLRAFRRLTCDAGSSSESCGLAIERLSLAERDKLRAGAVQLDLGGDAYAFFAAPVDLRTVAPGRIDAQVPDGVVDPHPFLGRLGVPWFMPTVVFERLARDPAYASIEQRARIPRVILIGSVLLDSDKRPEKSSYHQAPIAVAPVAALELIAGRPECRVPYFPPGTPPQVLMGRVARCGELPTGYYGASVLSGLAGGRVQPAASGSARGDSPMDIVGGRYSGQSWTIPNELAVAAQVGSPANVVADQGYGGTLVVHDPSPGAAECPTLPPIPLCANDLLLLDESLPDGLDVQTCVPESCCKAVKHLCGLPRCEVVATPDGRISDSPTSALELEPGKPAIPSCLPFDLPPECCLR